MKNQSDIMKIKITTLFLSFSFLASFSFAQTPDSNGILYVKKGSTGNGSAWNNAIGELADALKAAKSNTAIQQIWVTSGTYRPLYTPEDGQNLSSNPVDSRDKAFLLVNNVKVYGGFAGTETTINQRNIAGNTSTLSGDIGTINNNTDNAYHVLISSGTIGSATLDGFTILNGNANGSTSSTININGTSVNRGSGGGMYSSSSSPSINNCIFWGNRATYGGGMHNNASSPSINNSTFSNNIATNGAGINNLASSSPTIGLSHFLNNNAQSGGGMCNVGSSLPIINNSLFSGNNASSLGGGIFNISSSATINSCTFSGNSAPNGGGQAIHSVSSSMIEIQINNSIIWKDSGFAGNDNLKESLGKYVLSNCILQYPGTGYNINGSYQNLDPKFTNAKGADNTFGTNDDDLTLTSISPAIGAGDNSLYTGNINTDKDLKGSSRLTGSAIDIGAYESPYLFAIIPDANGVVYVKKGSTGNGSSWSNALGELADALRAAKTSTGIQQIWISKGIYKPLYHAANLSGPSTTEKNNAFVLVNNVQLYGGFNGTETNINQRPIFNALGGRAEGTVLSGDFNGDDIFNTSGQPSGGNTENVYHVVISAGNVGTALLDGLTITGGYAYGDPVIVTTVNGRNLPIAYGAGIFNESSSPKLNNVNIKGNACASTSSLSSYGGGVFNFDSSPVLTNVNITGNIAGSGGGIYNLSSSIVLVNVAITNNRATYGGGIYSSGSGGSLTNVTISNNSAITNNSALYCYTSPLTINNSIIRGSIKAEVGTLPSYTNSLIEGSGGSAAWNTAYGTNGGNNIDVDPLFVNPGGGNYRLQATSPAINGASNALYTNAGGSLSTDKDLAGNPRLNNTNIDMGAFEYVSTPTITPTNGIIYVNQNVAVTSNKTGDSWANALPQLADALVAASTNTAIQQIWVTNGVYKPLYSPEDGVNFGKEDGRNNAFRLVNNVKIYGGFTGTETSINDRNSQQRSILSGDIDNNDVTLNDLSTVINGDNAYHTVIASEALGTAILDGFIITGGNANGTGNINVGVIIWRDGGGGLYNVNSSSKFNNVSFFGNSARYGGGVYFWNSAPRLSLFNLIYNTATAEGGGMYTAGNSTPKILSGLIVKNTAVIGGGMLCFNASPTFVNTTITDNYASSFGGAMYSWSQSTSSPKLYNSIVWGNKKGANVASNMERDVNNSTPIIQNSLIEGSGGSTAWVATTGTDGGNNIDANPVFTDVANNDYSLQNNSPAINVGSNLLYTNEGGNLISDTDLAGNPRLREANIDLGAFEAVGTLPITLLSFQIKKENNAAVLTWETTSEKDNAGFEIFRATNDRNFINIATVAGKGTTNLKNSYTWHDRKPLNGINYYKLIQKDHDGKTEELGIKELNFDLEESQVLLYPNPVTTQTKVQFTANTYQSISLTDISGKVLQHLSLNKTETEKAIITDSLPKGIYLLKLTGQGRNTILKMIKN